jgi:hypothetical protein
VGRVPVFHRLAGAIGIEQSEIDGALRPIVMPLAFVGSKLTTQ